VRRVYLRRSAGCAYTYLIRVCARESQFMENVQKILARKISLMFIHFSFVWRNDHCRRLRRRAQYRSPRVKSSAQILAPPPLGTPSDQPQRCAQRRLSRGSETESKQQHNVVVVVICWDDCCGRGCGCGAVAELATPFEAGMSSVTHTRGRCCIDDARPRVSHRVCLRHPGYRMLVFQRPWSSACFSKTLSRRQPAHSGGRVW